jgi:hypothetical protein
MRKPKNRFLVDCGLAGHVLCMLGNTPLAVASPRARGGRPDRVTVSVSTRARVSLLLVLASSLSVPESKGMVDSSCCSHPHQWQMSAFEGLAMWGFM